MKTESQARVAPRRTAARAGDRKLTAPVTLFAAIEAEQREALRALAFAQRRSLADLVREALSAYLAKQRRPADMRRPVAPKP
jgi:hypothetical protein